MYVCGESSGDIKWFYETYILNKLSCDEESKLHCSKLVKRIVKLTRIDSRCALSANLSAIASALNLLSNSEKEKFCLAFLKKLKEEECSRLNRVYRDEHDDVLSVEVVHRNNLRAELDGDDSWKARPSLGFKGSKPDFLLPSGIYGTGLLTNIIGIKAARFGADYYHSYTIEVKSDGLYAYDPLSWRKTLKNKYPNGVKDENTPRTAAQVYSKGHVDVVAHSECPLATPKDDFLNSAMEGLPGFIQVANINSVWLYIKQP